MDRNSAAGFRQNTVPRMVVGEMAVAKTGRPRPEVKVRLSNKSWRPRGTLGEG
ncbi:hypothetical protein CLV84_0607 [Neolewinella xylanilytica]|uniref:Uncharacterized protein n=1 Tax=Neolewinella xylanilytica TaxID=1514080 RepID=A0A2S6I855_9BACT|nr:hypothetical protein CLV84_0607 [Neolewinella xylanilytica]